MLECAALFISDLHLGSNQCEARALLAFLERVRPAALYLVGDIIDLPAIRLNARVDESFLAEILEGAVEGLARRDGPHDTWLSLGRLKGRRLLRGSHLDVLRRLADLRAGGVRLTYIPGNHDAYFRRHAGLETEGFRIRLEDVYETPDGRRFLVRHGDEYDRLMRLHSRLAGQLIRFQEPYSGWINALRHGLLGWQSLPAAPLAPEAILQGAVDLLADHWDWPVPADRRLEGSGFSLAFTLERALKSRTGHDRVLKTVMSRHLARQSRSGRRLDGMINGHTHIPEATAFAWPGNRAGGAGEEHPCHFTYYNDGSWARSQRRLGRTALVVAGNGTIGMVRFDRRRGIVPFRPPRYPFNTYPMRPCSGCGVMVSDPRWS